jgi:hypothetical protein
VTPEVEQLTATLHRLRRSFMKKLAGVSDADARRGAVPSGTSLAGLLQHLAFVESKWFGEIVAGRAPRGTRSMDVDAGVTMRARRAAYRDACATSDEIIATIGDAEGPVVDEGRTHNLRWALLAVIDETARHAGHADIIREQIDGVTGR